MKHPALQRSVHRYAQGGVLRCSHSLFGASRLILPRASLGECPDTDDDNRFAR